MKSIVEETSILTSRLTTAETTPKGFSLRGSVHFNIGTYRFKGGEAQFLLKSAEIILDVSGCALERPAYIQRYSEIFEGETTEEKVGDTLRSTGAAVGVDLDPSHILQIPSAHLKAKASHSGSAHKTRKTKITESASGERIAFSYCTEGGRWIFSGRTFKMRGREVEGLFGDHLQKGEGEKGFLAIVETPEKQWSLKARLTFSPGDVVWWKIEGKQSKFAALFELMSRSEKPEAFISKMALAKWLSSRARVEPFFRHSSEAAAV